MLHYVVRNSSGFFYSYDANYFYPNLHDARITTDEGYAIGLAEIARSSYPNAGVRVSAFRVEFSDV